MGEESTPEETRKGTRIIIYIIAVIILGYPLKEILVLILSAFEGGYNDLRGQLLGMCGNAWWGGMNMSNYFLKPTPGDCDGITTTFWVGSPILLGYAAFIVLYIKNKFIFKTVISIKKNTINLLIYTGVILVVTMFRYLAGFSPKNAYWAFPDGIILGLNLIGFLVSYDNILPFFKGIFSKN